MQYFCNLNGRRKESMNWSLHTWFDKIGPWAAEMKGVIILYAGGKREGCFTFHHYSWSETLLMILKLGQRSQMVTTSRFINLVSENPLNTEKVIGDSISGQCG